MSGWHHARHLTLPKVFRKGSECIERWGSWPKATQNLCPASLTRANDCKKAGENPGEGRCLTVSLRMLSLQGPKHRLSPSDWSIDASVTQDFCLPPVHLAKGPRETKTGPGRTAVCPSPGPMSVFSALPSAPALRWHGLWVSYSAKGFGIQEGSQAGHMSQQPFVPVPEII